MWIFHLFAEYSPVCSLNKADTASTNSCEDATESFGLKNCKQFLLFYSNNVKELKNEFTGLLTLNKAIQQPNEKIPEEFSAVSTGVSLKQ